MTSFLWKCCFYGTIILITISSGIVAYNFDVNNVIVYEEAVKSEESRKSYHGFSVALWNPGYGELNESWIFIGAPRANSTAYPGINEPGTVLKCKIGESCQEWTMNQPRNSGPVDGSWLGGSMGIENGIDGNIMVCGPRWLDKQYRDTKQYAWPMSGICYRARAKDFSGSHPINEVSLHPLQDIRSARRLYTVEYYVMAESGFSIHIVPDASRKVILGCPGLKNAHGTSIQYSFESNSFLVPIPPHVTSSSYVQNYDYSGYAVTSGYYFGLNKGRFYVSSAPRSANLYGRIILFKFLATYNAWITIKDQQRGNQVGEYFGAALASCDINGDKYDDLIVGAPQWTKIVDEGRIYIYKGGDRPTISEESSDFHGEMPRARFGSTITCLGDIDLDGYQDIAVGAPYHDEKGAVYIYHGSKNGLRLTQRIAPKDTKGFGISISQPSDIDNNGYGDIAVGAYLSGRVTVFRSKRAVVTMVKLTTDLPQRSLQQNASSFDVKVCSSYSGKGAPKKLNVITELKVDESLQRAEIIDNGRNLQNYVHQFPDTLNLNSESCRDFTIKMKTGDKHYLEILKLSAIQNLKKNNESGTLVVDKQHVSGIQNFDSSSAAIINELHSKTKSYLEVVFALECNNSCNSNLIIGMVTSLENDNTYVIGSDQNIELNISVSNSGDQAFRAQAIVIIPFPIRLTQIPPSSCTRLPIGKDTQVTWDIANPLNKNETRSVTLILDMSPVTSNTTKISLNATATTQSNNTAAVTSGNDKARLQINCKANTDIGITRKNTLDRYPLKGKNEQIRNIAFQHIYEVKNYEVTRIDQAQLSISIPTHWIDGGNQIEIVRINKTTGYLDGQELYCKDVGTDTDIISSSYDATTMTGWLTKQTPDEKFEIINGKVFSASPDNRTININCTNPSVKCKMINCLLGPFTSTQSVARLALMFDLVLENFTSGIIEKEDIIFFVTNGSVSVLETPGETLDNKPNLIMIGTTFTGSPMENRVPPWVIPVSVFVGLLLLILVIIALFKFGFFKRNKQMELRALLEEKNEAAPDAAPASTSTG